MLLLLEDILSMRMDKMRRNVHQLSWLTLTLQSGNIVLIDMTNVGLLEIHIMRPFMAEAFSLHRDLSGRLSLYNPGAAVGPDNGTGNNLLPS